MDELLERRNLMYGAIRDAQVFDVNPFEVSLSDEAYKQFLEAYPDVAKELSENLFVYANVLDFDIEKLNKVIPKLTLETMTLCGLTAVNDTNDLRVFLPEMKIMGFVLLIDELIDSDLRDPQYLHELINALIQDRTDKKEIQDILDLINVEINNFPIQYRGLIRAITFKDILLAGLNMKLLSKEYFTKNNPDFITLHADEIIDYSVKGIGLMAVANLIFITTQLKCENSLTNYLQGFSKDTFELSRLLEVLLRLEDDYDDSEKDTGSIINLCNKEGEFLIEKLMQSFGMSQLNVSEITPGNLLESFIFSAREHAASSQTRSGSEEIFKNILLKIVQAFSIKLLSDAKFKEVFATKVN